MSGQEEELYQKGYVTNEDFAFTVSDSGEIQNIKQEQEETKLEVEVIDKETKEK